MTHDPQTVQRQIGFELLSIFKGATTESIDEAVDRVMALRVPDQTEAVEALQYAQCECRLYIERHTRNDAPYPTEAEYLADRVAANCERVLAKIGGDQ